MVELSITELGPILQLSPIVVVPFNIVDGKIIVPLPMVTSGEINTPSSDTNSTPLSKC